MKAELARKESDLGRAAAAADAQAALVDELKGQVDRGERERERLAQAVQNLEAQAAAAGGEAREAAGRAAALVAQLDEKTAELEAARVRLAAGVGCGGAGRLWACLARRAAGAAGLWAGSLAWACSPPGGRLHPARLGPPAVLKAALFSSSVWPRPRRRSCAR